MKTAQSTSVLVNALSVTLQEAFVQVYQGPHTSLHMTPLPDGEVLMQTAHIRDGSFSPFVHSSFHRKPAIAPGKPTEPVASSLPNKAADTIDVWKYIRIIAVLMVAVLIALSIK